MNHVNYRSLFQKAFFFALLASISYLFFDRAFLSLIPKSSSPLLKAFSFSISPPFHIILWTILLIIAWFKQSRWTLPLFQITLSQWLCVGFARIFKVLIGRARPDIFLKKGIYGFYGLKWNDHYHSFPSGHTLTAFTLATSCAYIFPRFRIIFYLLATFLSLSRPMLSNHYLSDVIATVPIGIMIGTFVYIITRRTNYETP